MSYTHTITFKPDFKSDEEYKKWYNEYIAEKLKDTKPFLLIEMNGKNYIISKDDFKEIHE